MRPAPGLQDAQHVSCMLPLGLDIASWMLLGLFYTLLFAFYELEIPMMKWEIYEFGHDPPVRLVSEGLDSKSASQIGPLQFMVERS